MPREFTEQEIRNHFLQECRRIVSSWSRTEKKSLQQIAGAVFSVLAMIDGASTDIPGFLLIPNPHPDDKQYSIDHGENWYPQADSRDMCDIAGSLHDEFFNPTKGPKEDENPTL